MSRIGCRYKTYMQPAQASQSSVPIPASTWRRWLISGRITEERLKELGIRTTKRRRHARRQADILDEQPEAGVQDAADQIAAEAAADFHSDDQGGDEDMDRETISPVSSLQRSNSIDSTGSGDENQMNVMLPNLSFSSTTSTLNDTSDESDGNTPDNEGEGLVSERIRLASILKSKLVGPDILNTRLHPNIDVSKFEVLLMILHLSMRHRMTDVFIEHLFLFAEKIVKVENGLGMSKHLFFKLFNFSKSPVMHFYCPQCNVYLGEDSIFLDGVVECSNEECERVSNTSSHNDGFYFLTLDFRSQLRDLLNKPGLKLVSRERPEHVVCDLMDGHEYKCHSKSGRILSNENALTLTIATDGSPVFKKGKNSLWPIHFYVNEIVPNQRFKSENILLGGLWFGSCEANINIFMQPIVTQLKDLETTGVVWEKEDGSVIESPIYVMSCVTDSVARPKVQHHMQFNGAYACGVCLHPNVPITVLERIKVRKKDKQSNTVRQGNAEDCDEEVLRQKTMMRYVNGCYDMRTNYDLRDYMLLADGSPFGHIMGSTGKSVFFDLKYFNMVYGFPIDYMHAVLLGTVRRTVNLWFDSTSNGCPYYIGLLIGRVNDRLENVTLPKGFRPPRKMSDRIHWKANEWRAFLLYFSLPLLDNILPAPYFSHFRKLVLAIYTLTKEAILIDEIADAHKLLQEFTWEYQHLYDEKNMVYNIHITSHLAQVVKRMGPLWAFSAFPFESANRRLVNLAMGTKGVSTQICSKYLMTSSASKLLQHGYQTSEDVLNFCCTIIGFDYLKNAEKGSCDETLVSRQFHHPISAMQKQAMIDKNLLVGNVVVAVNRAVINGKLYHSRLTTRQKKACDSCIRLVSGEFALIDLIVVLGHQHAGPSDTGLLITKLNISTETSLSLAPHIKQCCLDSYGEVVFINSSDIAQKCIFYSCNDKHYVAEMSNFYETD